MHHVRWRELTAAEHDAVVTALRDLATGRALLLAEVAGILERASEVCRQAAQLRRDAGAGREAIPRMDGGGAQPEGSRDRAAVLGAVCTPEERSAPDTVAPSVGSHKPVRKR
jgi:hypothetical protein